MPYVAGDYNTAPSVDQLQGAAKWPSGSYHRLANVSDMKNCIASGYCFRVGFTVYESFEESVGPDGIWTPAGTNVGGHEVLAFGYDDSVNGGSFHIRNSWGPRWADHGNFWFRYVDASDPRVLQDAWIQHLGKW